MHLSKKITLRKLLFTLLLLVYLSQIGLAGEQIVLSSDGSSFNQNQINEAINQAASQAEGITVFLTAGLYEVDNTIIMRSNVRLLGDPNAIIKVSSTSSQFFKGKIGVISCQEAIQNVEIGCFQIDGNIEELPASYSDSRSDTDHDCEKLIILWGNSNNFAKNIKVHDMKLYNSFSDGIFIFYADGVVCYNNIISNCQHEGIYFSVVRNGKIYNNKIAGITSDCGRLDNCDTCLIEYNLFFSYGGESYGAYKHGENGLQIGDAGSSHGYNAEKDGFPTKNIEVRFNTFADPGLKAIWYHNGENVYIHDNEFVDASVLETMGIPIGDISIDNQPTLEMSEKAFSSIFDILNGEFTESGRTNQTAYNVPLQVVDQENGIIAGGVKIVGFKDKIVLDNISYIPDEKAILTQTKVIQNPNLGQWAGIIKQMDKNVDVNIENGTAHAVLTVKTSWYTQSKDSKTGKSKKSKIKTSTTIFEDSYSPAPKVLERNNNITAYVDVYSDTKNPIAKLRIPATNATQRIEVLYKDNTTTHSFLIGERMTDEGGVQYTAFSRCELWNGTIPHMGNEILLIGKFDPSKLAIKYYTPYESFDVENVKVIYHKTEEENHNMVLLRLIVQIIMGLYAGYKIFDIAIN